MLNVTDALFEQEVLKSQVPVMVDFWAPWCGPCRMIAPVVEELAKEYEGRVKIVKMNTDENPVAPQQFGIQGIPTLMVFKAGALVDRLVGAASKATIKQMLDRQSA
jgi:thioredoxin 1